VVALLAEPRDFSLRADDAPAVRAVDRLHETALRMRASDIHLEPTRAGGRVRLRVDGVLRESEHFAEELFAPVVSRVKLLAAMDIAERRVPQDGRYAIDLDGRALDARVSSMPTIGGEKLVIRLLDLQAEIPSLSALGMSQHLLARYQNAIHAAHGFVVVCGPTGSGKTTTLYASLAERNVEGQHLCTVEDPVEVQMTGVAQVQVNVRAGVTFASVLRAFLRQDPNVIMLGEMRDGESAAVAMSAALSGTLVMATLHASDAPRAIERLVELGLDRQTLASGITAVVAQRLVRRRSGDGYAGRTAIFELLPVTGAVADAIARGASANELSEIAAPLGYAPLAGEGSRLVSLGETTREEIERVTGSGVRV
jgi:type II secretory ATPase GspE/PulE/Tfp pilus assembly ATPase PilB-like protein